MIEHWIRDDLLWCHVSRRSERNAQRRHETSRSCRSGDSLRYPEIRYLRVVLREKDVVRLDVTMYDAALVRVRERRQDVAKNFYNVAYGQLTLAGDSGAQRFAFDERHRVVGQTFAAACCQHRHDVRVLQLRGELNLPLEPLEVDCGGQLGREKLDDDFPVESRVGRHKDARHAATAELVLEGVSTAKRLLKLIAQIGQAAAPSS